MEKIKRESRKCSKCGQAKKQQGERTDICQISDKRKSKSYRGFFKQDYYCKKCRQKYAKQYYKNPENKNRILGRATMYYYDHREAVLMALKEKTAKLEVKNI